MNLLDTILLIFRHFMLVTLMKLMTTENIYFRGYYRISSNLRDWQCSYCHEF